MTSEPPPHSIADYLRGYESEGQLRGFRCTACGFVTASWGVACARCGSATEEETDLAREGRVVAFTVVHVPTEEMVNEAPYAYVLVALDGGGEVAGWMPGVRSETALEIGVRVRFEPGYRPGVQFVRLGVPAADRERA